MLGYSRWFRPDTDADWFMAFRSRFSSSFTCITPTINSWDTSNPKESSQRLTLPSDPPEVHFSKTSSSWKSLQSTTSSLPMCFSLGCVCPTFTSHSFVKQGIHAREFCFLNSRRQKGMRGPPEISHPFSYRCQLERICRCSREIRRVRCREARRCRCEWQTKAFHHAALGLVSVPSLVLPVYCSICLHSSLQDHAYSLGSTTGLVRTEKGGTQKQNTKSKFVALTVHCS